MKRFLDLIEKSVMNAMVVLLAIMVATLFAQIVLRFAFKTGMPWVEELCRFLFVWLTMFGAAVALRHDRHIKIDFVLNQFPRRIRLVIECLVDLCILAFILVLIGYGWKLCITGFPQKSPALQISMFFPYFGMVASSILMIAFFLESRVNHYRKKNTNVSDTEENK